MLIYQCDFRIKQSEAMLNMSAHHLPQYYQPQPVPATA